MEPQKTKNIWSTDDVSSIDDAVVYLFENDFCNELSPYPPETIRTLNQRYSPYYGDNFYSKASPNILLRINKSDQVIEELNKIIYKIPFDSNLYKNKVVELIKIINPKRVDHWKNYLEKAILR